MSLNIDKVSLSEAYNAILDENVDLFYQPIYDIEFMLIIGVEVKTFINNENPIAISAKDISQIYSYEGMLAKFTTCMLHKLTIDLQILGPSLERKFDVYVNLTPEQIQSDHFTYQCFQLLASLNSPYISINIEISEWYFIENMDLLTKNMNRMRIAGIRFFIDNFRMAYSNYYLSNMLHIDGLKIDKSFIADFYANKSNMSAIHNFIDMARHLSLRVMADGIEDEEQLCLLFENQIYHCQGNYLSKPLSINNLIERLFS